MQTDYGKYQVDRWLFTELAAMFFASKAGELLNIDYRFQPYTRLEVLKSVDRVTAQWKCQAKRMCFCERAEKWLFYYPERVSNALKEVSPQVLEDELSYQVGIGAGEFVEEVARRWSEKQTIPHEIGLALGYPVKDVLGYMGLVPLPCSGCCGWCVFGDLKASNAVSEEYRLAKLKAASLARREAAAPESFEQLAQ